MKLTTFTTILTVTLTATVNLSAFASPINAETVKENRIETETTENNKKSDQKNQSSQEGSQGSKCRIWC